MPKLPALACFIALPQLAQASLTIDGIAEPQWQTATQINDLVLTQPDSGAAPGFQTTVRYLALPEGIAFFFENSQDPNVFPTRAARQPRDNVGGTDRVNVMLDFDGSGEAGYNFTLTRSDSIEDATISNEKFFNSDWDGLWYHAVRERSDGLGWDAEILVPWSSALMRQATGATRTVGVYVDRVIGASETRAAHPAILFFKPQFLSLFEKVQIPAYSQGLLKFYPYLTALNDFVGDQVQFRAGADIFWKPSSNLQLTATINPDFGQVEADDLVVNFDAVETFFSDKRPFFTENQAAFVRQSPEEEQLIYTRRVGGARDDGRGSSDIDLAAKLSGSAIGLDLGLFAVRERDPDIVGRSVTALRVKKPGEHFDFGYLGSYVERPFLDRIAAVHAFDAQWQNDVWLWNTTLLASEISAAQQNKNGSGGFSSLTYKPNNRFDWRADITRYGNDLDYNDLGFQRRSNFIYYEFAPRWSQASYPEGHWLRSSDYGLDLNVAENSAGRNLYEEYEVSGSMTFADGANSYFEGVYRSAGVNDLISRGNGALRVDAGTTLFANYESVRRGNVSGFAGLYLDNTALSGRELFFESGARYWWGDDFNARVNFNISKFKNRTLWRGGTLFGVFSESDSVEPSLQMEYFQGTHHELRLKAQWLAIRARDASAYRLQRNEYLQPSAETVPDFAINSFGFQVRYRYKINQESDLFLVYSRGGESARERGDDGLAQLLSDSLELRDADQFLVKLRYAF
jgi:hypothetical protein